jgi:transposase
MRKVGRPKGMTVKIQLTPEERAEFQKSQKYGTHSAQELRRMRILLLSDEGNGKEEISRIEQVCEQTVYNCLRKYAQTKSVKDNPRSGRPEKLSGKVKAQIIATACSKAPKGRSRWTLRLLADEIIQLEILGSLSKNTIGRVLKKTNLNLGGKKAGV